MSQLDFLPFNNTTGAFTKTIPNLGVSIIDNPTGTVIKFNKPIDLQNNALLNPSGGGLSQTNAQTNTVTPASGTTVTVNSVPIQTLTLNSSSFTRVTIPGSGPGPSGVNDFLIIGTTAPKQLVFGLGTGVTNDVSNPRAYFTLGATSFLDVATDGLTITTTGTTINLNPTTGVNFSGKRAYNVAAPSFSTDLVPKSYVDALTGTTAPGTVPSRVGQTYVNTTAGTVYISKGTSASSDWVLVS